MNNPSEIIRHHSRSFSVASRFLPRRIRPDILALYAWCRTVDDVVDNMIDKTDATKRLQQLKLDVQSIMESRPVVEPASQWIMPLLQDGRLDPLHAVELIEGMELDCNDFQPRSAEDLRRYCYHAAGTVGLMVSQLMGSRSLAAKKHAVALGIAMQLTNIARDVREDALRGRSYLPGIDDPLSCDSQQLRDAVKSILADAEKEYAIAHAGIGYLPHDCRLAVRIALAAYREIGREITRQEWPVIQRRVVLSPVRFAGVIIHAYLSSFVSTTQPTNRSGDVAQMSRQAQTKQSQVADARSAVCLGISLTAVMAAVLFLLVFINPKEANYGYLPLAYSGVSLLIAGVFHLLSSRYAKSVSADL